MNTKISSPPIRVIESESFTHIPFKYRTTPTPITDEINTGRPEISRLNPSFILQSTEWSPTHPNRTIQPSFHASQTTRTTQSTKFNTTPQTTTLMTKQQKTKRIQPGTILMMDSEYLKQKYISTGLSKTFHRALLADYFGLPEEEMKKIGMTVVGWGFSYQVKDKATSQRQNRASKFFCDFKFRSATFNAGYVGAYIKMAITDING